MIEVAGADDSFRLAWKLPGPMRSSPSWHCYDQPQMLPLPEMYGKNLTFKTEARMVRPRLCGDPATDRRGRIDISRR